MAKKKKKLVSTLPPLSGGRKFLAFLIAAAVIAGIYVVVNNLYLKYIAYPAQAEVDYTTTRAAALDQWISDVHSLRGSGETGYLSKEISYANSNKFVEDFMYKVAGTVNYIPDNVVAKNIYGNDMYDIETDELVYIRSYIDDGESVTFEHIDYMSIGFEEDKVKSLLEANNLNLGDIDYATKLIDVYCQYITSLPTLPIIAERRVVDFYKNFSDNTYMIGDQEDIFLDNLLFASDAFYDSLNRFSYTAGVVSKNPEWVKWNKLDDSEKEDVTEPKEYTGKLAVSRDWVNWSELSPEEQANTQEPAMFGKKQTLPRSWCGAYALLNGLVKEYEDDSNSTIEAALGDGSFNNPASVGTPVTTLWVERDEDDNVINTYPIQVTMVEYGVSDDAIDYFIRRSEQNQGMNGIRNQKIQYIYAVIKVKNLSDKKLTIVDNTSLCDKYGNMVPRTGGQSGDGGIMGLVNTCELEPDQSGTIEVWSRSMELHKKYFVWGANFKRDFDLVWFRVLLGNLEDESYEKGVKVIGG